MSPTFRLFAAFLAASNAGSASANVVSASWLTEIAFKSAKSASLAVSAADAAMTAAFFD